ncbi:MAG: hypothetical protein WDO73_08255 [Ignavibacteriota bacterium]
MDDFRVGSVPPSEPYGDRHPYDVAARRRPKQHHEEQGGEAGEDTTDTFEASSEEEEPPAPVDGEIEDFYRPSTPAEEE